MLLILMAGWADALCRGLDSQVIRLMGRLDPEGWHCRECDAWVEGGGDVCRYCGAVSRHGHGGGES